MLSPSDMQPTPAMFIAGDPALDFLNSVAIPVDVSVEWLEDGEGLLGWLRQARLVSVTELGKIRAQSRPDELDKVAGQARDLREWFRTFVRTHVGRPTSRSDFKKLEPLNRLLERDESFSQIAPVPGKDRNPFELRVLHHWRSPGILLVPLAVALARFVCSADFRYVKACEGSRCTLFFLDQTRGRARRWCSMAICGNRAKQAAHRHKLKATV
jgi:predicted RNA-binding Zn ribbon-like protein